MSKGTTSIGIKAQFWQEIKDFVLDLGLKGGLLFASGLPSADGLISLPDFDIISISV